MDRQDFDNRLMAYLYDEMTAEERAEFERHLENTPEDARALESMGAVKSLYDRLEPEEPPMSGFYGIMREARAAVAPVEKRAGFFAWLAVLIRNPAVATALTLCIVAGTGILLIRNSTLNEEKRQEQYERDNRGTAQYRPPTEKKRSNEPSSKLDEGTQKPVRERPEATVTAKTPAVTPTDKVSPTTPRVVAPSAKLIPRRRHVDTPGTNIGRVGDAKTRVPKTGERPPSTVDSLKSIKPAEEPDGLLKRKHRRKMTRKRRRQKVMLGGNGLVTTQKKAPAYKGHVQHRRGHLQQPPKPDGDNFSKDKEDKRSVVTRTPTGKNRKLSFFKGDRTAKGKKRKSVNLMLTDPQSRTPRPVPTPVKERPHVAERKPAQTPVLRRMQPAPTPMTGPLRPAPKILSDDGKQRLENAPRKRTQHLRGVRHSERKLRTGTRGPGNEKLVRPNKQTKSKKPILVRDSRLANKRLAPRERRKHQDQELETRRDAFTEGMRHYKQRNDGLAITALKRALRSKRGAPAQIRLTLARIYARQGKTALAIAEYKRTLRLAKGTTRHAALFELAGLYAASGRQQAARQLLTQLSSAPRYKSRAKRALSRLGRTTYKTLDKSRKTAK